MTHDNLFVPHKTYERPRAVKDRYDPSNLFSLDMSIPPTSQGVPGNPRAEVRP